MNTFDKIVFFLHIEINPTQINRDKQICVCVCVCVCPCIIDKKDQFDCVRRRPGYANQIKKRKEKSLLSSLSLFFFFSILLDYPGQWRKSKSNVTCAFQVPLYIERRVAKQVQKQEM